MAKEGKLTKRQKEIHRCGYRADCQALGASNQAFLRVFRHVRRMQMAASSLRYAVGSQAYAGL